MRACISKVRQANPNREGVCWQTSTSTHPLLVVPSLDLTSTAPGYPLHQLAYEYRLATLFGILPRSRTAKKMMRAPLRHQDSTCAHPVVRGWLEHQQ